MTFAWPISPSVPVLERPVRQPRAPSTDTPVELARLKSALDAIPNEPETALTYDDWWHVIAAIDDATGHSDEGYELAVAFSERSGKHQPDYFDTRIWPCLRSEREGAVITAATIYHMARAAGWVDPDAPDPQDASGYECAEAPTQIGDQDTQSGAAPKDKPRHPIYQAAAFQNQAPFGWIVKGVLPEADVGVIFGASGSGKSFFTLDLACAIARGIEWRGKRTKQKRVLYIAAEGSGGFRGRLAAYAGHHEMVLEDLPLSVMPSAPNFSAHDDVQAVIHRANAAGPFGLIVVDTLAQVSGNSDENSAKDMNQVLHHCRKIRELTGAMVLLIHHSGKQAEKGARGSSAIRADIDVEIEIVRANNDRSATVGKLRDGEDGAEYGFRLHQVRIGTDEDGDPVTSCVLEYTAAIARDMRKLEPNGEYEIQVLDSAGALRPLGIADPLPSKDEIVDHGVAAMTTNALTPSNRKTALKRAFERLLNRGALVAEGAGFRGHEARDQ